MKIARRVDRSEIRTELSCDVCQPPDVTLELTLIVSLKRRQLHLGPPLQIERKKNFNLSPVIYEVKANSTGYGRVARERSEGVSEHVDVDIFLIEKRATLSGNGEKQHSTPEALRKVSDSHRNASKITPCYPVATFPLAFLSTPRRDKNARARLEDYKASHRSTASSTSVEEDKRQSRRMSTEEAYANFSGLPSCGPDGMPENVTVEEEDPGSGVIPTTFIAVFFTLICLMGVVGNALCFYVLCLKSSPRSTITVYILSLATADTGKALLSLATADTVTSDLVNDLNQTVCQHVYILASPFLASTYFTDLWYFGDVGCRVIAAVDVLTLNASTFTLTVMCLERYLAVVDPIKSLKCRSVSLSRVLVKDLGPVGPVVALSLPMVLSIFTSMKNGVDIVYQIPLTQCWGHTSKKPCDKHHWVSLLRKTRSDSAEKSDESDPSQDFPAPNDITSTLLKIAKWKHNHQGATPAGLGSSIPPGKS
ncbi:Urotensin-2 receptor [Branchiostoma belcheri]|nr:Urotensin-2 receptor [Branchiostoma belcheri]